jgi:GT2 family glycosyltransferase
MPKVSFLLPVHNGDQFIQETLLSISQQDFRDFDILILDDGSNDETAKVVEKFGSAQLSYVRTENNGLVSTLNHGLGLLDCDYVARIDADDVCFPDRLTKQIEFIEFTRAVAVSGRVLNIDESGRPWELSPDSTSFFRADPVHIPAREPYLPHPFMLAELNALVSVGGYRPAHLAEDSDLCWRLAENHRIALQDSVLGYYRIHRNSVSNADLPSARIQAVYSQLAAINAWRRREGRSEVPYQVTMAQAKKSAGSIEQLVELHSSYLSDRETSHLKQASAIKLMDIATYRALALSQSDLGLAREVAHRSDLTVGNRETVSEIMGRIDKWYPPELKTGKKNRLAFRIFG